MNQIIVKLKTKIFILICIVVYFLLLQSINSAIYLKIENKSELTLYLDILNYIMVFLPVIILFCKNGFKINILMLLSMLKKYCFPYLIYIFIIYFIRQQVKVGVYFIDIGITSFLLSKSVTSEYIMMYVFWVFQSFISLLFFIILPFYTLVLHSYIFGLKKDNAKSMIIYENKSL